MSNISVGYGTQTPQSITGKAIGGFCASVGVFILTLPVPIVVNSFASYYKNRLWRNEVAHKRSARAAQQTELVKEMLFNGNGTVPNSPKKSLNGDVSEGNVLYTASTGSSSKFETGPGFLPWLFSRTSFYKESLNPDLKNHLSNSTFPSRLHLTKLKKPNYLNFSELLFCSKLTWTSSEQKP